MSSLIPGYKYDIFISYRQKDNKHDCWVTEFVKNLRDEIESTFKEEISLYFDENPHDGLLETYDVDASLKEKLKCLIFIPIISRTYCDPKSFAWAHEFKAFLEMAAKDQFGLKIELPNGNIACRALPVQIHDLDPDDKKTVEEELGCRLRGIEFIYSEPGVNRPLNPEDKAEKNLHGTKYLNQINKVANAIREIIHGLKDIRPPEIEIKPDESEKKNIKIRQKPLIASAAILIIVLIVSGILITRRTVKISDDIRKSIAVLPFTNDSPEKIDDSFINGVMSELIGSLQKIKSFSKVLPRISVEKYRNTSIAVPKIAKDLKVNYIVYADGQKYGNLFRIHVYLVNAANKILWSHPYEGKLKTEEIFDIYSKIADEVASALKVQVTPEEKQSIQEVSTSNMTTYTLYHKAIEEISKYNNDPGNILALDKGEGYLRLALKYDSTFSPGYSGLASIYDIKHYRDQYYNNNFLDSCLILLDKALYFNYKNIEAHYLKAVYYSEVGKNELILNELDKALLYNPNYFEAYQFKGYYYTWDHKEQDYIKVFENYSKAIDLNPGKELPGLLRSIGSAFNDKLGYLEKANSYFLEAFKLDNDSSTYCWMVGRSYRDSGNYKKAIWYIEKSVLLDSAKSGDAIIDLANSYAYYHNYKEALKYYLKYFEWEKLTNHLEGGNYHRLGYVYSMLGNKTEAERWFKEQRKFCSQSIGRSNILSFRAYYDLAGVSAFTGDKVKAYENLKKFSKMTAYPWWWLSLLKHDPLFDSIRDEKKFRNIINDIQEKYDIEHERVRKWLEENKML